MLELVLSNLRSIGPAALPTNYNSFGFQTVEQGPQLLATDRQPLGEFALPRKLASRHLFHQAAQRIPGVRRVGIAGGRSRTGPIAGSGHIGQV